MDDLWATKSEDGWLIARAISFQDLLWSWSTNVADGQATCDRKTALCTIVHRAVKTGLYTVNGKQQNHKVGLER